MFLSVICGKIVYLAIRKVLNRSASTWPGHIALRLNSHFIKSIIQRNGNLKIVLIVGTNGKTTTTKALDFILKKNNVRSIRNEEGSNLLNGFASLLIKHSSLFGNISKDALLFEADENSFTQILEEISNPDAIVLLNLFRDQLDRYGEINITSQKWREAILKADPKTLVIANSDDPQIVGIARGSKGKVFFYSVRDQLKGGKKLPHAADSTSCPLCRSDLRYSKIAYSHLGNYACSKCDFANPDAESIVFRTNLMGVFNTYNLTAAILTAVKVLKIKKGDAIAALSGFAPAFGRQERLPYKGRDVLLLLSKNPTGFNESLKIAIKGEYQNLLLALNDRVVDGRDVSWIWDVDFELLSKGNRTITVSGSRGYDLANRLQYAEVSNITVKEKMNEALDYALKTLPRKKTLAILPTYSAMLDIRKILTGKSIL